MFDESNCRRFRHGLGCLITLHTNFLRTDGKQSMKKRRIHVHVIVLKVGMSTVSESPRKMREVFAQDGTS